MFQVFDAITFLAGLCHWVCFVAGAGRCAFSALPLVIAWLGLYGAVGSLDHPKRVGPASQAASDARSNVTGRVVDAYTNIHSVKMFSHGPQEMDYAKDAIEESRRTTFQIEMRIFTIMDVTLVMLNGLLILGVVGGADLALDALARRRLAFVAATTALALRLNAMTAWIMWALTSFFRQLGVVKEGMETIAQPITLVDQVDAQPLKFDEGRIEIDQLTHHYGRQTGGLDTVSLQIEPGQKIGLIGRSGAGKVRSLNYCSDFMMPTADAF